MSLPSISIFSLESIHTGILCTKLIAIAIIKFCWIDYKQCKVVEDPYEVLCLTAIFADPFVVALPSGAWFSEVWLDSQRNIDMLSGAIKVEGA